MHLNKTLRTIPKVRRSIVEGSLEVKLPTIWRDEKQSRSRVRRRKIQVRKSQKKEDTVLQNVRKVANRCVFPSGSGGSKSRLAKAAGAEPCGQRRN